jgi:hypothetical protein
MSSVVISGDTSGQVTLAAPAVAGTNTATLPVATGELSMLGTTGQTWQAVTRVLGTTYYNTTGKPIVLDTEITSTTTINNTICTINGVAVYQSGHSGNNGSYGCWVIPPGASYVLSTSGGTTPTVTANTRELR